MMLGQLSVPCKNKSSTRLFSVKILPLEVSSLLNFGMKKYLNIHIDLPFNRQKKNISDINILRNQILSTISLESAVQFHFNQS